MNAKTVIRAEQRRRCALEGCKQEFVVQRGREQQRYCSARHRYRAWFNRKYVERAKVAPINGNNRK